MNRIVDVLLNLIYRSVLSCRHFILHSLVCTAGLTILFWPMFFSGFTRLQDNPGDTLLNHYILEHTWTCITRTNYTGDFWNPPFFYPARNVLAYSETLIGVAPVYWFFRLIFAETHAYQAWIITMAGGTYICTVWALRRMEISHLAAATASFLFSFGMIRSNQVGHQQLLCQLFTAPAIAFLWSYLQHGKTINLLGLTGCATMQILACIYLGWFTAFAMALFSIMVLIFDKNSRATVLDHLRNNPVASSLIACAAITCLIPIITMYLIANTTSPRPLSECILYAPRWSSWLAPPPGWIAWPAMSRFTHLQHGMETWLFFGFMPYILSLVSIISIVFSLKKSPSTGRLLIICALGLFVFLAVISLVWKGYTIWAIIYSVVPGAKAIRVVARIWTVAFFFFVVAGAAGYDRYIHRLIASTWWRRAVGLAVLAISMVEQVRVNLPSFVAEPFYREANRLAEQLEGSQTAYIRPPITSQTNIETAHICAMWAGLKANVRVINGYSGRIPADYPDPGHPWDKAEIDKWLGEYEKHENVRILNIDLTWK